MAVDPARNAVIAAYRARREVLIAESKDDDAHRRPVSAARKRQAARLLSRAISDEVVDDLPSGIVRESSYRTFDDVEAEG